MKATRRDWLAGVAALSGLAVTTGCTAQTLPDPPPLKSLAPYPLGVAATASQIVEPDWAKLAAQQYSRLTPEWEMKMEYVLGDDGTLRFDRADRLVAFAEAHGMAFHGHTLIWYDQPGGPSFAKLGNRPDAFLAAYADYIQAVVGRYKGRIGGWDVVNEPVWNDGHDLRPCLWRQVLGDDYIGLALTAAHQADPAAKLFINDYNLELTPAKRKTFLTMVERVLKSGAPLHGIGSQTHIQADLPPQALKTAIRDLASTGLMLHMSEVDISLHEDRITNMAEPRLDQIRLINTLLDTYDALPSAQRYGVTIWGLRDSDSWINRQPGLKLPDEPLLFDRLGRPKPMARAFAKALEMTV
ncbi:endo-1,4-beta-xylanase [Asticcacaulis sp. EMRT-3]|uniref:endo-1,4-beta-xylanase n=1 Tax=Asticcacaulis sp. EMRT-3 TaxID=3040349 RepID=UPI0024AFEC3A|nr:endo-1,4-beta-xylanase [Asticcacaulis sp. EMRT-3]MDI7776116.1 endo-1,4-beta-xylanase [Asticcacaulis sp. EMRT-3]